MLGLSRLFARRRYVEEADRLYATAVAQARAPVFYARLGVTDSVDGRFDMIVLHAWLLLRRIARTGPELQELGQALFDRMFLDMDRALREMGVGDLSVGKKIRKMAEAFYGRTEAYERALTAGDLAGLEDALRRNLYRGRPVPAEPVAKIASYVFAQAAHLDAEAPARFAAAEVDFLAPPDDVS